MSKLSKEDAIKYLLDYTIHGTNALDIIKNNFDLTKIPEEYFSDKDFVLNVLNGMEVEVTHNQWTMGGYEKVKEMEYKNNPYIYPLLSKDLKMDKKVLNIVGMRAAYDGKTFKIRKNNIKGIYDIFEYIPDELKSDYKLMFKFYNSGRKNNYEILPEVLKKDVDIAIKYTTKMKGKKYYPDKVFKIPNETLHSDDFIYKYVSKINNNYHVINLIYDNSNLIKKVINEVGFVVRNTIIHEIVDTIENYEMNCNKYKESMESLKDKQKEIGNKEDLTDRIEYYKGKLNKLTNKYNNMRSVLKDDEFYINFMNKNIHLKDIDSLKYSNEDDKNLYNFLGLFDISVTDNVNNWKEIIFKDSNKYELYMKNYDNSIKFEDSFHIYVIMTNGNNIIHSPEKFKNDRDMVMECANRMSGLNEDVLKSLPKFQEDKEVILKIIKKNPSSYRSIKKEIIDNKFLIELLEVNLDMYYFLEDEIKKKISKNEILNYYKKLELSENLTNEINQSKSKNKTVKL